MKISDSPLAFLLDTPGVMIPNIMEDEIALKLSLIGSVKDVIADK
jgi:ribosome biogenesis GTPase A